MWDEVEKGSRRVVEFVFPKCLFEVEKAVKLFFRRAQRRITELV